MLESAVSRPKSNLTLVQLKGQFAFGTDLQKLKPELTTLAGEPNSVLILDFSQVEYADSSGIGVLLYLDEIAREAGSALRIAGATRRVHEVLHITHTDKILTMDPDVASSMSRGAS
ncbi:MAG: STAS domain-containing protein [Acidobacteriaceae bacterium]